GLVGPSEGLVDAAQMVPEIGASRVSFGLREQEWKVALVLARLVALVPEVHEPDLVRVGVRGTGRVEPGRERGRDALVDDALEAHGRIVSPEAPLVGVAASLQQREMEP